MNWLILMSPRRDSIKHNIPYYVVFEYVLCFCKIVICTVMPAKSDSDVMFC